MRHLILSIFLVLACSSAQKAGRVNVVIPAAEVSASGSGFVVRDRHGASHLLTAGHVCELALAGGKDAKVSLTSSAGGGTVTGGEYRVRALSRVSDLCELEEEIPSARLLDVLDLSDRLPPAGERLRIVGAPYGVYPVPSEGVMVGWALSNGRPFLVGASPMVGPGNSGSPVMDDSGEVIGVLVMGGAFFFYAVPFWQVAEFLATGA